MTLLVEGQLYEDDGKVEKEGRFTSVHVMSFKDIILFQKQKNDARSHINTKFSKRLMKEQNQN